MRCVLVSALVLTSVSCDRLGWKLDFNADGKKISNGGRQTLVVSFLTKPRSLDWNLTDDLSSEEILANLMEGLTTFDLKAPDQVVPSLAASWQVGEGGLKYTFKLNQKARWSDGKKLEAQDFLNSFERSLSPQNKSRWSGILLPVRHVKEFAAGKVKSFADVGIKAPDEKTLVFYLNHPVDHFPAILAHHSLFPIRKDLIEKFGPDWSALKNLVTIGAFKISHFQNDTFLTLERDGNDVSEGGSLQKIDCRFDLSADQALKLFKNAKIDVITAIPVRSLPLFKKLAEISFSPVLDVTFLAFNIRQRPLSNPVFRRSIGMSIDRDELVRILSGGQRPMGEMIPPGLLGFESNRGVRFEPDAAKELLGKIGYKNVGSPVFDLSVQGGDEALATAEILKTQIKRNVDIDVNIVKDGDQKTPGLFLRHWQAVIPKPDDFLSLFSSSHPLNPTGWKNRDYDDLLQKAVNAEVAVVREKAYAKAQHILTDKEMPVVPLYADSQIFVVQKKVKNFPFSPLRLFNLKGVFIE